MSGAVNPIENPQAWDKIEIGQTESPGICKVGEFKRTHEWDVKKGKGTVGGTVTFVGRPPAKGSIVFYLGFGVSREECIQQFVEWDTFRPLLKYDPTKQTVQAVDIYHPSLADLNINSVVTESIGNIVHEGQQLYSITVEFLEYYPAPKQSAVGTPTGSISTQKNTTPGATPDPVADAQQAEIAALLKKASEP